MSERLYRDRLAVVSGDTQIASAACDGRRRRTTRERSSNDRHDRLQFLSRRIDLNAEVLERGHSARERDPRIDTTRNPRPRRTQSARETGCQQRASLVTVRE